MTALGRLDRLDLLELRVSEARTAARRLRAGSARPTRRSRRGDPRRGLLRTDAPPPSDTCFRRLRTRLLERGDPRTRGTWFPRIDRRARMAGEDEDGVEIRRTSPTSRSHDPSHGPGPPPNMFRPVKVAPRDGMPDDRSARVDVAASSTWLSRNAFSDRLVNVTADPRMPCCAATAIVRMFSISCQSPLDARQ